MTVFKAGDKVKLTGECWDGEVSRHGVGLGSIHELVAEDDELAVIDHDGDPWFIEYSGYEVELVESAEGGEPVVTGEVPALPDVFNAPKSRDQELEEELRVLSGRLEDVKSAQSYADMGVDALKGETIDIRTRVSVIESSVASNANDTLVLASSVDDRFAGLSTLLKALVLSVPPEKFTEAELTIARLAGVDALTGKK